MEDAIKACNLLWATIIKKMNIDFFSKIITFELVAIDSGIETYHTLEIKDYDSFIWLEKSVGSHIDYNIKNCDYHEFTAITFGDFHAKSDHKWLKQYSLSYNIAIEIWESALLIKSNTITIDGLSFSL